jgi:mono/diheme cytochrome c family protein
LTRKQLDARHLVLLAVVAMIGCSESGAPQLSEAAQRGKAVYLSVCIACHNVDPALDGSLGPANAGASRELLEARVVRGEYPPGYKPKRDSRAMPAFPQLADEIDDLTAYLAECCPTK